MEDLLSFLLFAAIFGISIVSKIVSEKKKSQLIKKAGKPVTKVKRPEPYVSKSIEKTTVSQDKPLVVFSDTPIEYGRKNVQKPLKTVTPPKPILSKNQTKYKKKSLIPDEVYENPVENDNIVSTKVISTKKVNNTFALLTNEDKKKAIIFHEIISKPKCFDISS